MLETPTLERWAWGGRFQGGVKGGEGTLGPGKWVVESGNGRDRHHWNVNSRTCALLWLRSYVEPWKNGVLSRDGRELEGIEGHEWACIGKREFSGEVDGLDAKSEARGIRRSSSKAPRVLSG